MADLASESGHWYDPKTGEPRYTYTNKKGEVKNTTLREARKEGWVPSVTTILGLANKPALTNWMVDQGILAALTTPRIDGEPEADYLSRIKISSKEQASKAAERGTLIHGWVQKGFEGKIIPAHEGCPEHEGWRYYESAFHELYKHCGKYMLWSSEKSFARDGYGGKCDLHNENHVIDLKTTDKDLATIKTWDEHSWQLSSYRHGLGVEGAKCGILYISVKDATSKLMWIDEDELRKGFKCFLDLLSFWYHKTGIERG
jgi:hypothetical protein